MSTPISPRRACALLAMLAWALVMAAPAHAGTASFDPITGTVSFVDSAGEDNAVTFLPAPGGVEVSDAGPAVTVGSGCLAAADGISAVCGDGTTPIASVHATLGAGNDVASTQLGAIPVNFDGGLGDDVLNGGSGADLLDGGPGADTLNGGDGNDTLDGGDGNDVLDGGAGADVIDGQGGDHDKVSYASRSDAVFVSFDNVANDGAAGEGDNILGVEDAVTGAGNDTIVGDDQPNVLDGGAGDDTIAGAGGADQLLGGPGDDRLDGGLGADVLDGGDGRDLADYSNRTEDLTVSLDGSADDGATGEGDNVVNVEDIAGGSGNDVLSGDDGPNLLSGGPGDDRLQGNGGADTLRGDAGNDVLLGGAGADDIAGGDGVDVVSYADHADPVAVDLDTAGADDGNAEDGPPLARDTIEADVENLTGTSGDDVLAGSAGPNVISGGGGNDLIAGRGGADTLLGDDGNDTLAGGADADVLRGGSGDDLLDGGGGADELDGGSGVDVVTYASRTAPVVASLDGLANDGEAGEQDTIDASVEGIIGGAGDDSLTGDSAANYLDGGPGNDVITGGPGSDTLVGGEGDDEIHARDGTVDHITCGAGTDGVEADATEDYAGDCELIDDGSAPASGGGPVLGVGGAGASAGPGLDWDTVIAQLLNGLQLSPLGANTVQAAIASTVGPAGGSASLAGLSPMDQSRSASGLPRPHPRGLLARLSRRAHEIVVTGRLQPAAGVGRSACGAGLMEASMALAKGRTAVARRRLDPRCGFRLVLKLGGRMRLRGRPRVVVRFLGNPFLLPYTEHPAPRLR